MALSFLPLLSLAIAAHDLAAGPPDGPEPERPLSLLFGSDDYPSRSLRNDESGLVRAFLDVDATGRVAACTVVQSTATPLLDEATCRVLRERARFVPHRDATGEAVVSSYVADPVFWRIDGGAIAGELTIFHERLFPDGAAPGAVWIEAGERGGIERCATIGLGAQIDCAAIEPWIEAIEWTAAGTAMAGKALVVEWGFSEAPDIAGLLVDLAGRLDPDDPRLTAARIDEGRLGGCVGRKHTAAGQSEDLTIRPIDCPSETVEGIARLEVPLPPGGSGYAYRLLREEPLGDWPEAREAGPAVGPATIIATGPALFAPEFPLVPMDTSTPRGDVRMLFSADDYPEEAQRAGHEGTVRARLTVDATGRVSACETVESSGHASLDERTCAVLTERARFDPATQPDGTPMAGAFTTAPITWRVQRVEDRFEHPMASFTYRADGSVDDCVLSMVKGERMAVGRCNDEAVAVGQRIGRDYAADPQLTKMVWTAWDLWGPREAMETRLAAELAAARIMRSQTYDVTLAEGRLESCTLVDFSPRGNASEECAKDKVVPWICGLPAFEAPICNGTTLYRTVLARRPLNAATRVPFERAARGDYAPDD